MNLTEAISLELGAAEPWPHDVKLFQPYEIEQILLPDNANCLAVKAFLKMCGLPFEVDHRMNAEFMSPSGQVPFIKCGKFVIPELEGIVQFVNQKGISLTEDLDSNTKMDMRAYMTLVHSVLVLAELYISWVDKATLNEVTLPRHGSPYPWPLNWYQNYRKKSQMIRKLKAHGWYDYTLDEVLAKVDKCCAALSEKLGDNFYFFGDKFSEVDCMVFGHVFTILTTPLPSSVARLPVIVRSYDRLLDHCSRVEMATMRRQTDIRNENVAETYMSRRRALLSLIESIKMNDKERKKISEVLKKANYKEKVILECTMEVTVSTTFEVPETPALSSVSSSAHLFSDLEDLPIVEKLSEMSLDDMYFM